MKRIIKQLRNLVSGDTIDADKWLASLDEPKLFALRANLKREYKENRPEIVCEVCNQPVYLASNVRKEHYFKHWQELGDCPVKTKGKYSQEEINRMKYNGAKESKAHIEIKEHLYEILSKDSLCSQVNKEQVVKSIDAEGWWKKPDLSLYLRDNKIVIEIQLSTTYLDVIIDRTLFYEKNETVILWVFAEKAKQGFRFAEKDIFYSNKRNAFIVTSETKKISEKTGRIHLLCCYQEPYHEDDKIKDRWSERIISIDELKFDKKLFKIYYFDYEHRVKELNSILLNTISKNFESYWINQYHQLDEESREKYLNDFLLKFKELDVEVKLNSRFINIINSLYSLKHGKIIGYRFRTLLELSNFVLEVYKDYNHIYFWAIDIFNRRGDVENIPSFKKKVDKYREEKYPQNQENNNFLSILFPELSEKIKDMLK